MFQAVSRRGSRASTEEREDDPVGDQTAVLESGGVNEGSFHRLFRATKQVGRLECLWFGYVFAFGYLVNLSLHLGIFRCPSRQRVA